MWAEFVREGGREVGRRHPRYSSEDGVGGGVTDEFIFMLTTTEGDSKRKGRKRKKLLRVVLTKL